MAEVSTKIWEISRAGLETEICPEIFRSHSSQSLRKTRDYHDCLRDIYTVVAYHIFHHHAHISFPLFQQKMLGHQAAAETVAYNKPNVVTNTIKTSFPQHRITITMDEGCYTTQLPPTVQGY